jgi:hypothetical protein
MFPIYAKITEEAYPKDLKRKIKTTWKTNIIINIDFIL